MNDEVRKRHILRSTLTTDMDLRVLRWEKQTRCYGRKMQGLLKCSRLKPSYEVHLEGFSNFSPSVEGYVQIQDVNLRT